MSTPTFDSVYLLLGSLQRLRDSGISTINANGTIRFPSSDRSKFFPELYHWAIQVRGYCYEVTSVRAPHLKGGIAFIQRIFTVQQWEAERVPVDPKFERIKVGATRWSDLDIGWEAENIWQSRFATTYKLQSQNCQNFAMLLFQRIRVPDKDPWVSRAERQTWKAFPDPGNKLGTDLMRIAATVVPAVAVVAALGPCVPIILVGGTLVAAAGVSAAAIRSKDKKWLKKTEKDERRSGRASSCSSNNSSECGRQN